MKVLEHGRKYKEIRCSNCGALLSYCPVDIKTYHNMIEGMDDWIEIYKSWINCAECVHEIVLNTNY